MGTADLEPRRRPRQRRSRERVERILDATAELVERGGIDALTTNAIAAQSGINVASLYQFFPNKYAVVAALAARTAEQQRETMLGYAASVADQGDWRRLVEGVVDALVERMRTQRGLAALRRAVQSVPELRAAEVHADRVLADAFGDELARRAIGVDGDRREAIARTLVEAGTRLLDLAMEGGGGIEARLVVELKLMLVSYLANYFPDEVAAPAKATSPESTPSN